MKNIPLLYLFALIIAVLFVSIFYAIWKNQYTKYNLLRLDPLEECKTDFNKLRNASGKDSVIWLIGDSRIAQWNTEYLKPLHKPIINLGIEGQTSKQTLENFKNYLEISLPYCVVLQVGINDLKVIGLLESKTNEIVSNCFSNTVEIINLCKRNKIKVIYMPVIPTGNIELLRRLVWDSVIDIKLGEFNKQMKNYCLNNDVPYFDFAGRFNAIPGKEKKTYQKGFLHLSDAGYKHLSNEFIRFYNSEFINHKQN